MDYYAHSDKEKDQSQWHLLKNHLHDTATIASAFARAFNAEKMAYVAGLLHDIGKYAPEFQRRLKGLNVKVDHSTAGAVEAERHYGPIGKLFAYIVAGHHCGLPDWGSRVDESSLEARINKDLTDYSAYAKEIELPLTREMIFPSKQPIIRAGFSTQFLTRFLFSCLVDADFLDTEKALDSIRSGRRSKGYCLKTLADKLDVFLDAMVAGARDTPVNRKRKTILLNCREKANYKPGLYTLTVPTGGGKTLSSLSFALRHALKYNKDRVIYVIPYTSIIEQNADVFRNVLGAENVLEHHSNFSYPQEEKAEIQGEYTVEITQRLKLAAENWDVPIITTTNVQFFESLFASRSSKCRKLHHVANSVIIIDEAQMIPTGFLKPCLSALLELVTNYNTTVVLCTATQPALEIFFPEGFKSVEIIDDPKQLYEAFKRVQVHNMGEVVDEELAARMVGHDQILCIVNSKKHARLLYEKIREEGTFHLSTRMCPVHRTEVLAAIKERLKAGQVCRVISTQLIEAGVDIDFPVVYRSMAGIDSIAQAAGRCNREGLRRDGEVFVFWPEPHGMPRGWLSRTASWGNMVFEHNDDPLGLEAVKKYFSLLYDVDGGELDKKGIMAEIKEQEKQLRFPFRSIAEKFKLIDSNTSTIIIPWGDACLTILREVENCSFIGTFARELQKYGVEVYDNEFTELLTCGALKLVSDRFYVLREEMCTQYYSRKTGLIPFTESMFLNDTMII